MLRHFFKSVTFSMDTVTISNVDVKVWTQKNEFPQGYSLRSSTQSEITRQITSKITDIEYYWIKDEISSMGRVEYNTAAVINVKNVDDIEYFAYFQWP